MTVHSHPDAVRTEHGLRTFTATTPDQVLALGDPTRFRILHALRWTPASAKRLSEHLDMTHGRVGHHLKILEAHGLVELAEERPVRGLTERIYRTTFDFIDVRLDDPTFDEVRLFFQLCSHLVAPPTPASIARNRQLQIAEISQSNAEEFSKRLSELIDEFAAASEPGEEAFAIAGAVFRADPTMHRD